VYAGRVEVANFRCRYRSSFGGFEGVGTNDPITGRDEATNRLPQPLREASICVRFVSEVEERGGFERWRADVFRVFAGLRFLLRKRRISARRSRPCVAALVPLMRIDDDLLRQVLEYAVDASSTALLPTMVGCVVNHAYSARSIPIESITRASAVKCSHRPGWFS